MMSNTALKRPQSFQNQPEITIPDDTATPAINAKAQSRQNHPVLRGIQLITMRSVSIKTSSTISWRGISGIIRLGTAILAPSMEPR